MNLTSTSDHSPENRIFGFWRDLPLARKLLMAFGALFIFAVIIAIVTLIGLNRTQAAYEDALAQGIEIRRLSDHLEYTLLQARQSEKNFLLHWREEGFETAYANYVIPHAQNVAAMREDLKQLADFGPVVATLSTGNTSQAQYEADIATLTQNVDTYEKSFNSIAAAYERKGQDEETDFESQFRVAATIIQAKTTGLVGIESTFLRLRLSEKNYLADPAPSYVIDIHTLIPLFKNRIAQSELLEPAEKTELLTQSDAYLTAFDGLVELDKEIAVHNENLINASSAVESLTANFKSLGEQLAAEDIDTARSSSIQTFTTSIITVLIVLALSILLAAALSQQLTRPIISLTNTAREISRGESDVQAQVNSTDEIGTLAKAFNIMTAQLRGALQNLDLHAKELEQQTVQLELTGQQSQKRAQQLQTIAEIARYISAEKDLKKLLPLITQTVSEQFGFYHIGIFLLDDSGKFAVLLASNSPGGQAMLRRQHSLGVGQTGIVGNVTSTGNPRIALDTGADATYFNNPDLPQTRSELALPLKIEKKVIGALDIQSTDINAFSNEDVEALATLADQVSLAIQNARLFNQIEKSLAESNAIQRQYVRETWRNLPREEKLSGFRYSVTGAIQLDDETIIAASEVMKDKREISIPIILRGETIGTLSVHVPLSEQTSADQMDLIKAVAERVALSADNARLFEKTTRRADRERIISEITSKIGTSVRTENILKTTAKELNQFFDGAEVLIRLTADEPQKENQEI